MKQIVTYSILVFAFIFIVKSGLVAKEDFPVLKGPYLDQEPPGIKPEIFAPGIISTGLDELRCTFTPEGNECYYSVVVGFFETILWTRLEGSRWTKPEVAPFCGKYLDGYPALHPDGSKLYFHSFRPIENGTEPSKVANIWVTYREGNGWGVPRPVGPPINGELSVSGPSVTKDGTLYFAQWQPDKTEVIMRSKLINGQYTKPERLPVNVNTSRSQFHSCIAPDESYLILPLEGRKDSIGSGMNYYVTFRDPQGGWSDLINLGKLVNSKKAGAFPSISADGKYFFYQAKPTIQFVKSQNQTFNYSALQNKVLNEPAYDRGAIFWVDAKIIEDLKPENLK